MSRQINMVMEDLLDHKVILLLSTDHFEQPLSYDQRFRRKDRIQERRKVRSVRPYRQITPNVDVEYSTGLIVESHDFTAVCGNKWNHIDYIRINYNAHVV